MSYDYKYMVTLDEKDGNWIIEQLETLPYKDVYKVIQFLQLKWNEQNKKEEKKEENK